MLRQRLDLLCGQVELHPVRPDAPTRSDSTSRALPSTCNEIASPVKTSASVSPTTFETFPTASPSVEITCAFSSIAFHATCGSPPLPSPRRAQSDCPPIRHTGPCPTGRSSETTRRTATRPVIASASSRSKQRRAIPAEIP